MLSFHIPDKPEWLSLGLLSGTSVDGIDVGLTKIEENNGVLHPTLLAFDTLPFDSELQSAILTCLSHPNQVSLRTISQLDFAIGEAFSEAALTFMKSRGESMHQIDFIASHGQTFWHEPVAESIGRHQVNSTFQLGEASIIAARTQKPTISDFRTADMATGGEGAPLMPYLDYLLFGHGQNRLIVNIGGISNITAISSNGSLSDIIYFDCGPGNTLLDQVTQRMFNQPYDKDGKLASRGKTNRDLLNELLMEPFYSKLPPKSTGRELFSQAYVASILFKAENLNLRGEDILASLTELSALIINQQYEAFVKPFISCQEIILSGGGSLNPVLTGYIKTLFEPCSVKTMEDFQEIAICSQGKEAVLFSVLGYQYLKQRSASLKSKAILGKLSLPPLS